MSGIVERLHRAGLRATGPRVLILTALEHDCSHPTAEQLFAALWPQDPFLAFSTVYQILATFIRTGLCRRVCGAGDRMRVDGTPQDHDYAICTICGAIFDFKRWLFPLPSPPARLPRGLLVTGLRLEDEVICAACRKASRKKPTTS